jgi:Dolichyl-phosphate-mannose-protein mannosyltransferase
MIGPRRRQTALALIIGTAFAARLAVRLVLGRADLLAHGYTFYLTIADQLVRGHGFCMAPGVGCAVRTPAYPLLVAAFLSMGSLYPGLVVAQSALGTATVWIVWRIGRDLFGSPTGLLAAAIAACSPYTVVHDTALQETVLLNLLFAGAAYGLIRLRIAHASRRALGVGLLLALATLTTARVALVVPAALIWVAASAGVTSKTRLRLLAAMALPIVILVGGWVARNWRIEGAPVLTTEAGGHLWIANNAMTFSHFPTESIDRSARAAFDALSPDDRRRLDALEPNELAANRLLANWAVAYIRTHPIQTIWNVVRKLAVPASGLLSPARGPAVEALSLLVYAPIHVLAAVGFWQFRHDWRTRALLATLVLSFAVTTAVFWAHTSHTSCLDAALFVYAASVATGASRAAHAIPPPGPQARPA